MAVPVKADLDAEVASLAARVRGATARQMDNRRQGVRALARAGDEPGELVSFARVRTRVHVRAKRGPAKSNSRDGGWWEKLAPPGANHAPRLPSRVRVCVRAHG